MSSNGSAFAERNRMADLIPTRDYMEFVSRLKERIKLAQTRAVLAVNAELVQLYWQIGSEIVEK